MPRLGRVGRAFAVAVDRGGVGGIVVEEIEIERQRARRRIVDPADIPVLAIAVLAREDRIIADLARDQLAFGPVSRDLLDERKLPGVRVEALDEIGRAGRSGLFRKSHER